MRKRLLVLWSVLFVLAGLVALYAGVGELFSPSDDDPSLTWSENTCGSLADISHYTKHAVPDGNNPPWSGYDDSGPMGVDVNLRNGCLNAASAAQTTLIASGAVGIALLLSAPFVAIRRRTKPNQSAGG